jgi:tetratricopeptide (TPR) repeat protein
VTGRTSIFGAVLVLALAPLRVLALEVGIAASRQDVAAGEQFTVSVEVRSSGVGSVPAPTLPEIANIQRIGQYESRNFSYVNGRMTGSLVVQYLMVANQPGTYTLGPATAEKGDERATSEAITLTVRAAGSSAPGPPPAGSSGGAIEPKGVGPETSDDLLVLAEVDDETPFVNQQVTYTFTFLRRVQVFEGSQYTPPEASGFWVEELDTTDPTEVSIGGRRWVAERVRMALFPTGPGTFTIGPAKLRTTVAERSARRRDSFDIFGGDPFGFFRSGREVRLQTDPITIRVRPLPEEGKPEDFSGAVGEFQLRASVDKTDLSAGDPVTLSLQLAGRGNVKVVDAPNLENLDGFKTYESNAQESSRPQDGKIHGEKKWEIVLVATRGGLAEIPSIRMSTFNPEKQAYESLATDPIPITVQATPFDEALARGDDLSVAKERVRLRERDIRWVKPAPASLRRADGPLAARPLFLLAHAVPAALFAGAVWSRRRRDRLATDVRWARSTKARRVAEKHLQDAEKSLRARDFSTFHGETSKALRGFVADRLGVSPASLDPPFVRAALEERGAPAELVDRWLAMVDACDTARFSPAGTEAARAEELSRLARKWIADASRVAAVLALLVLLSVATASAAPSAADASFERGVQLYTDGDYDGAREAFREILASGFDDPAVHYNLGNAAFKSGRLGEAIYHYRLAHDLAPRDEDVTANLEYARFLAVDATENEAAKTDRRAESWLDRVTSEEILRWAPILASLAALFGIAGQLVRRAAVPAGRAASVFLGLWGVCVASAAFVAVWTAREPEAVILAKEVEVKNGPGATSATAFVLHEGAEVAVERERDGWIEISLPGELRGWIDARSAAKLEHGNEKGSSAS